MATDQAPTNVKKDAAADSQVGRAAVDARLATPDEIEACKTKLEKYRAEGREVKLSDVMIKAGVVTASQLKRLLNPADDSASPSVHQIPGFQILQKVGSGAMASVYKARQLSLDRIVAIKILPKRLSEDPEFVERFYKEGQAAASLNHNNIVQAIDVGEYAGYHYFVMEFVDGATVYDHLAKNRVFNEKEALEIIIEMAQALEHAHARGLIHRDVKPKNIMLTKGGTAKLADMGLARLADDAGAAQAEKGRAFGTPYYISPEQIRGVVDVDFRADIYSLGGTLYHMMTGRVPFDGPSPMAIMQKHLKQTLVPPDHISKSISTGMAEVIERMLVKDRKNRYLSTTDLLLDLHAIERGDAPTLARSGYDDSLLEKLGDGSGEIDAGSGYIAAGSSGGSGSAGNGPVGLLVAAVIEGIIILVLILLLIF